MCVHVTGKEAEARVNAGPTVTQLVNEEEGCKAGSPFPLHSCFLAQNSEFTN